MASVALIAAQQDSDKNQSHIIGKQQAKLINHEIESSYFSKHDVGSVGSVAWVMEWD